MDDGLLLMRTAAHTPVSRHPPRCPERNPVPRVAASEKEKYCVGGPDPIPTDSMKIPRSAITSVVEAVLELGLRRATKFLSPDTVVSATIMHQPRGNSRSTAIVLKLGKPNFKERAFIKSCQKAKEPFPVKKIQLKFYPRHK